MEVSRNSTDAELAQLLDEGSDSHSQVLQAEAELERRGFTGEKLRELMVFYKRDHMLDNMDNILYKGMEVHSDFFTGGELKAMLDIALKEYQDRKKDLYAIDHSKYWVPFI